MSGKRMPPTLPGAKGPIVYDLYRVLENQQGKERFRGCIMSCYSKEQIQLICEAEKGFQPWGPALTSKYFWKSRPANSSPPRDVVFYTSWE